MARKRPIHTREENIDFKMALLTLREETETFALPHEGKWKASILAMIDSALRCVNEELESSK